MRLASRFGYTNQIRRDRCLLYTSGTFLAFLTLFIGDAGNTGNTTPTNEVLTDDISVSIIFLSG